MKYGAGKIHIHKLIIPELPKPCLLSGSVIPSLFNQPVTNDKKYHFKIALKYRVSLNSEHTFTFIGESKFVIQDDGIPIVLVEIDRFISNMYLNFEIGWEEQTIGTPFQGQTLPNFDKDIPNIRQRIIDCMKA